MREIYSEDSLRTYSPYMNFSKKRDGKINKAINKIKTTENKVKNKKQKAKVENKNLQNKKEIQNVSADTEKI